jgi:hypothetical protein
MLVVAAGCRLDLVAASLAPTCAHVNAERWLGQECPDTLSSRLAGLQWTRLYPVMGQEGLICIGPSISFIFKFFLQILTGYVFGVYRIRIRIRCVFELQQTYPCGSRHSVA